MDPAVDRAIADVPASLLSQIGALLGPQLTAISPNFPLSLNVSLTLSALRPPHIRLLSQRATGKLLSWVHLSMMTTARTTEP